MFSILDTVGAEGRGGGGRGVGLGVEFATKEMSEIIIEIITHAPI